MCAFCHQWIVLCPQCDLIKLHLPCLSGSGNLDGTLKYFETLHPRNFEHRITKRDVQSQHPHTRQLEFDSMGRYGFVSELHLVSWTW